MPSILRSKAKENLNKAGSKTINDPNDPIQDGISAGFLGDYEGALEEFERAIHLSTSLESDKKHVAWFDKGQALMQMERYREAIEAFDKAIKYDSDDELSWFFESVAYTELGKDKEALEAANKSITLAPDFEEGWLARGDALGNMGKFEEALQSYQKALKIDPKSVNALTGRGQALLELRKPKEALVMFDKALLLEPDDPEILSGKGAALMDLKKYREALSWFNRALRIDPTVELTWYNKACLLSLLNLKEDAVDALIVAISLNPESRAYLKDDKDLDRIRSHKRFKKLLRESSS